MKYAVLVPILELTKAALTAGLSAVISSDNLPLMSDMSDSISVISLLILAISISCPSALLSSSVIADALLDMSLAFWSILSD